MPLKPGDGAGQTAAQVHNPYEGLHPDEEIFLKALRDLIRDNFTGRVPFKLEVTNGVARDRLTLNPNHDEVFMIKKKPHGSGKRQVPIDIMSEGDAKDEINGGGSYGPMAPSVIDPCCWWEWDGTDWVCVGYGD